MIRVRVTNAHPKSEIKEEVYIVGLLGYEKLERHMIAFDFIEVNKVQHGLLKLRTVSGNQNLLSRNDRSYIGPCLTILME